LAWHGECGCCFGDVYVVVDGFFLFFFFFLNGAVGVFLLDSAGRVCVAGVAGVAVRAE
jgi:hypothetical protein